MRNQMLNLVMFSGATGALWPLSRSLLGRGLTMIRTRPNYRFLPLLVATAAVTLSFCAATHAFSSGSPVCSITPTEMNNSMLTATILSPNGWSLSVPGNYSSGSAFSVVLANANPGRQFRGLLLWATNTSGALVGTWTVPAGYFMPAGCNPASLTHSSTTAKAQRSFTFTPPASGGGTLTFRAVVNEECGSGSCRAAHAFPNAVTSAEATFALSVSRNGDGAGTLSQSTVGIDCGAVCSANIVAGQSVTLLAAAAHNGVLTAWAGCDSIATNQCTLAMTGPRAVSATFMEAQLDVDDSGAPTRYDSATDGVLVVRYLLGLRGSALVNGAVASGVPTRSATDIAIYLNARLGSLDVDGDGLVLATTDGLMVLRYMLGLRGTALTAGARLGALSGPQIEARLAALMPQPLP